jgi:hypothetical protein
MKIREFIVKNINETYIGWDDSRSEIFRVKGTLKGFITIARSYDENNNIDRVMFNYYDENIIGTTEIPVVGVRLERNQQVNQFIYGITGIDGATQNAGVISDYNNLYEYFMTLVVEAINKSRYLGENMNNSNPLSLKEFMKLNPEIVKALKNAETQYKANNNSKSESTNSFSGKVLIDSKYTKQ